MNVSGTATIGIAKTSLSSGRNYTTQSPKLEGIKKKEMKIHRVTKGRRKRKRKRKRVMMKKMVGVTTTTVGAWTTTLF